MNCKPAVLFALLLCLSPAHGEILGYHVGNSLTVDSHPWSLPAFGAQVGLDINTAYHIRTSMGLPYIWQNPADVDFAAAESLGGFSNALPSHALGYLTLEPYPNPYPTTLANDLAAIADFTNLLRSNPANADTPVFIYAAWPNRETGATYADRWLRPATDSPTELVALSRAYFDILAQHTGLRQIPVGEVLYQLDLRLRASPLPGLTSALDLYRDNYHLNSLGQYVASVTTFTAITNHNPAGLTAPADFENLAAFTPQFYNLIHEVVWNVTALRGDLNGDGRINSLDIAPFIAALTGSAPSPVLADTNGNGVVNYLDIASFVRLFTGARSTQTMQAIPEPAAFAFFGTLLVVLRRRR